MANSENKTQATDQAVEDFIAKLDTELQREDSKKLVDLMRKISGEEPVLWGSSIIGFGQYHYKYDSGREGDMCAVGFSPRKGKTSIYIVDGVSKYESDLRNLGKHKTAKICLYVNKLSDVDLEVLGKVLQKSYQYVITHKEEMGRAA